MANKTAFGSAVTSEWRKSQPGAKHCVTFKAKPRMYHMTDELMELKRRKMQFVFVGEQNTNAPEGENVYAYQGTSRQ